MLYGALPPLLAAATGGGGADGRQGAYALAALARTAAAAAGARRRALPPLCAAAVAAAAATATASQQPTWLALVDALAGAAGAALGPAAWHRVQCPAGAYTRPLFSSTYAVLVTPPRVPMSKILGENHAPNVFHKCAYVEPKSGRV